MNYLILFVYFIGFILYICLHWVFRFCMIGTVECVLKEWFILVSICMLYNICIDELIWRFMKNLMSLLFSLMSVSNTTVGCTVYVPPHIVYKWFYTNHYHRQLPLCACVLCVCSLFLSFVLRSGYHLLLVSMLNLIWNMSKTKTESVLYQVFVHHSLV